ncbi:MAG TPA: DUF881 domain-containing protein [Candidatus Dormibacteraeota bacterium]|nr:DUF881 domain-containing protein [Candidatus Dormibacteraeota bacterium]
MLEGRPHIGRVQLGSLLLMVLALGFLFAVQLRSQATAQKYLTGQDNVSLGLLITGLSQSNQQLADARGQLQQQVAGLRAEAASGRNPAGTLQQELIQLEIADGTVPVHGPGLVLTVSFALHDYEVQDLTNALRQSGAEAIELNGRRITARSVIGEKSGRATVDGRSIAVPYRVSAVGDPAKLASGAESISASLKARGGTSVDQQADIKIAVTVPERPVIYSSFSS